MLRIDLAESEYFAVRKRSVHTLCKALQILDLIGVQGQTFTLVVCCDVLDVTNRCAAYIHIKYMCVQAGIIALQHLVISSIFVGTVKLFDTANAVYAHILAYFDSVGTPWSYHLAARSDKRFFDVGRHETTSAAEEP